MKDIQEYIIEKLSLNSKDIVKREAHTARTKLIRSIMDHIGLDEFDTWRKYIYDWVSDNNVSQVFYYADPETLFSAVGNGMPKDIADDFEQENRFIELCQDELDRCKELVNDTTEPASIMANENMFAFVSNLGTLYCTVEKIQNLNKS